MANPLMVVLSDGETWSGGGELFVLKDGVDYPYGDADNMNEGDIITKIDIEDLLEAYNKVHGTNY